MMTRQDFESIAAAIRITAAYYEDEFQKAIIVRHVARNVADALAKSNPRFDRQRFLSAAGVEWFITKD